MGGRREEGEPKTKQESAAAWRCIQVLSERIVFSNGMRSLCLFERLQRRHPQPSYHHGLLHHAFVATRISVAWTLQSIERKFNGRGKLPTVPEGGIDAAEFRASASHARSRPKVHMHSRRHARSVSPAPSALLLRQAARSPPSELVSAAAAMIPGGTEPVVL